MVGSTAPICMSHSIGFVGSWPCGEIEKDKFAWCFFSFIMWFPFFFFLLINLLALFLFCIFLGMTLKANEMVRLCKINVALGPKVVLFWAKMPSFFRYFGSSVRSTCTRSWKNFDCSNWGKRRTQRFRQQEIRNEILSFNLFKGICFSYSIGGLGALLRGNDSFVF